MFAFETASPDERQLLKLWRALDPEQRTTVIAFAEFLCSKQSATAPAPAPVPEPVPRPERETVVGALKRLRLTYPQLDSAALLNEASLLMSAHLLQGRPAKEVIDELEDLFARESNSLNSGDNALS